jgi:hypothetical protein
MITQRTALAAISRFVDDPYGVQTVLHRNSFGLHVDKYVENGIAANVELPTNILRFKQMSCYSAGRDLSFLGAPGNAFR